jgi:hypothetical protein
MSDSARAKLSGVTGMTCAAEGEEAGVDCATANVAVTQADMKVMTFIVALLAFFMEAVPKGESYRIKTCHFWHQSARVLNAREP